ncbi:unnamed protein product [Coregonus sp. 'balchen']|nr:unnamed protein product [Coregonus sp. 'balchen']
MKTPSYTWDCVATCFFIDTAHNVIDYVETIWNILKPGGVWINLGPLLYHFENMANELSIELSYEDVRAAILKYGFHLEVKQNTWDCVATCFFIDTAHNVIDYVETIWNILKPGGVWINLGPLLYHFENMANELSIELSYEDVRAAILKYGFHLESMLKYLYDCVFFVARKPDHLYDNGLQVVHENRPEALPRRESCDSLT